MLDRAKLILLALLLVALAVVGVGPRADAAPATTEDVGFDICTVLKAQFDPQNTAYNVTDWIYFQEVLSSTPHVHDQTYCLFTEKPGVHAYGWLCSFREGHVLPTPGFTVGTEGPNPGVFEEPTCPW
jgi:hypothetical protein